jgi:predicted aconitase with swiveling domain
MLALLNYAPLTRAAGTPTVVDSVSATNTPPYSIPWPDGVPPNGYNLIAVATCDLNETPATPAGWTALAVRTGTASVCGAGLYWKFAGLGEPSSIAWSLQSGDSAGKHLTVSMCTVSNATPVVTQSSYSNGYLVTNPITPLTVGALVLVGFTADNAVTAFTVPSGWSLVTESVTGYSTMIVQDNTLTPDTVTPISTSSAFTGTEISLASYQIILNPTSSIQQVLPSASLSPTASLATSHTHGGQLAAAALTFAGSIAKQAQKSIGKSSAVLSIVQSPAATNTGGSSVTVSAVNGMVPTTVGNTLIAFVNTTNPGVGITVTAPTNWTQVGSINNGTSLYQAVFQSTVTSPTTSVPFALSSASYASAVVVEVYGSVNGLFTVGTSTATSTTIATTSVQPSVVGDLGLACFAIGSATSATPAIGWNTTAAQYTGNTGFILESQLAPNLSPVSSSATISSTMPLSSIFVLLSAASPSGLSFAGSIAKALSRSLVPAALSFVGAIGTSHVRLGNLTSAALSFSGSIAKQTYRSLTAGQTFSGSIATSHRRIAALVAASLTFAGSLAKTTTNALTASLSFSGSQSKTTSRTLLAGLTFAGSLAKATSQILAAVLSFAGTIAKGKIFALPAATVAFVGSLSKKTSYPLTAALLFTGMMTRVTTYPLSAALSFAGSISRVTVSNLAATLSFIGAIAKGKIYSLPAASLTFVGSISKTAIYPLTASLTFAGSITKKTFANLSAALTFVGAAAKATSRILPSASLSFVGSIAKTPSLVLTAGLSFIGSLVKSTSRILSAALTFSGSLMEPPPYLQIKALTAGLAFVGSFSKSISRQQNAVVSFTGGISKSLSRVLPPAIIAFSGNVSKGMSQALSAALSFIGSFSTYQPVLPQYMIVLPLPTDLPEIPIIPSQELLTAADSGILFFCHAGGFQMIPNYHTAKLLIQYQTLPAPPHIAYPLSIDPGGLTAHFVLYGAEFPLGGIYNLQLVVTAGTSMYSSPNVNMRVNPQITP